MYAFIEGRLAYKQKDVVEIDCHGVGYEIIVNARTLAAVPGVGEAVKLYTYYYLREDLAALYGFTDREEKAMFLKLISVSGVGPGLAMNALGMMTPSEISVALVTEDVKALTRVPKLGKKLAERMILELRGKIDNGMLVGGGEATVGGSSPAVSGNQAQEAITALMALGASSAEAARAVAQVKNAATVEETIVQALRLLDRG